MHFGSGICERRVTVDWIPVLAGGKALTVDVPKASGSQGTFGPAVVDRGKVPLYGFRRGVAIQLCAYVDEALN